MEDLKKKLKISDNMKKSFIYCFTLLQNSVSIYEFDQHLFNIYNVYCSPFLNSCSLKSFLSLKNCIANRNLNVEINMYLDNETQELDMIRKKIENRDNPEQIKNESNENLKLNSPFNSYYSAKIREFEIFKKYENDKIMNSSRMKNEFYCSELFSIIVKILHIMPLWTGCMIHEDLLKINAFTTTRLTNNLVENWFNQLRNHILKLSKKDKLKNRKMPSQIIPTEMKYIKQKYDDYYQKYFEKTVEGLNSTGATNKQYSCKTKNISELCEVWRSGKTNSKCNYFEGYFKNQNDVFMINENIFDELIKTSVDKDFSNIFDTSINFLFY